MRIVVNDIAASSGGALTILKSFYNYLIQAEVGSENEWIFLLNDRYIEETDNIKILILDKVKKSWLHRLKFDVLSGKKLISELQPDVVISLQNTITFGLRNPQVLYVHQSIPFQRLKKFSFFKSEERILAVYQYIIGKLIKESIRKADKTVVQTKWIKDAIVESTKISPEKVITAFPSNVNYSNYKRDGLFQRHNFFYPATNSIYKNHQCIYDACTILDRKGIIDYNVSLTIKGSSDNCKISHLGSIPFHEVMDKYNSSTLLFPSYIETVGLPLVEASQIGTVILAADCPYSREVLSGYENAYFFDPFDSEKLSELMERVILGQLEKKELLETTKQRVDGWRLVLDAVEEVFSKKR